MQFQTPQFIEIEDKIFGPLTFKQFIYVAGGIGISFVFYVYLPFFIAVLLIIPIIVLSLALAFYHPNNKPFIDTIESAFTYLISKKLYIWHKKPTKKEIIMKEDQKSRLYVPKLSDSKLKDLAWGLDVHKKIH